MLAAGVELYELRPDAEALSLYVTPPATPTRLGLHTKAVVVDGERAFVGSPNVDPRSMVLNTEIGVVGDGPAFAARVAALIRARHVARERLARHDGRGGLALMDERRRSSCVGSRRRASGSEWSSSC